MSRVARIGRGLRIALGIWLATVSAFAVPNIVRVAPPFGTPGSQQTIVIYGTGFNGTGRSVRFNGVLDTTAFFSSDQQINCKVPLSATTGPITVTVGGFSDTTTNNFVVLRGQPYITAFTPTGRTNQTISIYGSNLLSSKIWLGGALASTPVSGPAVGEVRVVVPAGAVPGPIVASNTASATYGTYTTTSNFFPVGGGPLITGFSPVRGAPGTDVSVFGLNFYQGATTVLFGTNPAAKIVFTSGNQIHAFAPNNASTAPISVITPYGTNTTSTNFIVGYAPEVLGFNPSFGPPGTQVTLDGVNFIPGATTVKLNGTNVAAVTVNSPTQLKATVQATASSGAFTVSTAFGTNSSSSNFVVTGGAPMIAAFDPPNGVVGGQVAIYGNRLIDVTNVSFGGVRALSFNATSPSQITATVPFGALNGPVTVINPYGTATTSSNFYLPPVISSLNPTSAPLGGTITIAGTNLLGATEVRFNGLVGAFTVVNNNSITATVPTNATAGFVTVKTPGGLTNSPASFPIAPSADLGIMIVLDRHPSVSNELSLLSAVVTNRGPNTASNLVVTIEKPFFFQIQSATASAGSISTNAVGGTLTLSHLAKSGTVTLTLKCRSLTAASSETRAAVTSTTTDLILSDNETTRFITALDPPRLDIAHSSPGEVDLSWSLGWTNFSLQTAPTMPSGGGGWVAVTNTPAIMDNRYQITHPTTNPAQFFRLMRPAP